MEEELLKFVDWLYKNGLRICSQDWRTDTLYEHESSDKELIERYLREKNEQTKSSN